MNRKKVEEQIVDLSEVCRQQAEHIINIEMELAEVTSKWKFLQEELKEIEFMKATREEINAS